ncbi:DEAD/DEAH box helicase family protein [Paenibacillus sp. ACRSA]|uniref:DEAD/DEAH box helicase family protein n=1 Tax=Paenibacillus sp. ACRSA TaxID=2918211 RepID=UPI0031BB0914
MITIEAGTGVGKSYFIKNTLYEKAKREGTKILFLVNRTRLKDQFVEEIQKDGKDDVIDIFLYQKVESRLGREKAATFKDDYTYIVCDEFHYFLTDSTYNSNTDTSFKLIMSHSNKTRIFMSATADITIDFFKFKQIKFRSYSVPHDYSHIKELIFYRHEKVLEKYLSKIRKGQQVIAFFTKASKAYELHKRFEDSMFVCAEGNSDYKKYVNKDQVKLMLDSESFEEQYLFTTSTLDNGINLRNKKMKYIVCDIQDVDTLIQCLGRKRIIDAKDQVTVVIRNITDKEIGQRIRAKNKIINSAKYLIENGSIAYMDKYKRNHNNPTIYVEPNKDRTNPEFFVNELRYFKECSDRNNLEDIREIENGYIEHVKSKLQKENYTMLDDTYDKATSKDYLDSLVGKQLFKDEQRALIKMVNLRDNYNRLQKSVRLINEYFIQNSIPYNIRDKNRDNKRKTEDNQPNPNFNKTFWTVAKHIY